MSSSAPVTFSLDGEGVGWIVFDDPAGRANVFNSASQAALAAAIDAAEASALKALVVTSAKERIFIAGADLKWLASLPDAASATALARTGQHLFQRLADFAMPVICAIHGACAGGGYELALACHWRIASDAAVTQIGLPETSIGTIPGWGGCVRLPRLVGVKQGLEHILKGQLLPALEAHKSGLVDEVVPAAELKTRAKAAALAFVEKGMPARRPPPLFGGRYFSEVRAATQPKGRTQPALLAAIDAVEHTQPQLLPRALEIEAKIFGTITVGETCKNSIHVFFLREAARKRTLAGWFERGVGFSPPSSIEDQGGLKPALPPIRRVGVIGAGVMGSGIAQWLAVHGFDVVIRDVQPDLLDHGMQVMRSLTEEAVKRGKLSSADARLGLSRVLATTGWDGFARCDVVIEAIVENIEAKRALFTEVAGIVKPDTILASNTSALPIEAIAGHVPNPGRTLGIHFFNPVSRMPLVELIVARETSAEAAERALALVKALSKSPVICRSSPGFLVTRVLFFYLNEAVRLWESGVGTEQMDAALRDFGWPMGPLRLIDEVGVDVTDFIFGEMAHYFPDRFMRSKACGAMLAAGLRGRKNGTSRGFYRYDGPKESLNDAETRSFAVCEPAPTPEPRLGVEASSCRTPDAISSHLMRVMAGEAERCLAEGVVKTPDDVDFALLSGAGFPSFRGGLLRWARASGVST